MHAKRRYVNTPRIQRKYASNSACKPIEFYVNSTRIQASNTMRSVRPRNDKSEAAKNIKEITQPRLYALPRGK